MITISRYAHNLYHTILAGVQKDGKYTLNVVDLGHFKRMGPGNVEYILNKLFDKHDVYLDVSVSPAMTFKRIEYAN